MNSARLTIGRVLRVLGIALLVTGVGVSVAQQVFGLLPRLLFAGPLAILVSTPILWFSRALAAGTLRQEITAIARAERRDFLRLRTNVSLRTALFVIIGAVMLAVLFVLAYAWWAIE